MGGSASATPLGGEEGGEIAEAGGEVADAEDDGDHERKGEGSDDLFIYCTGLFTGNRKQAAVPHTIVSYTVLYYMYIIC